MTKEISTADLDQMMQQESFSLLDVRNPEEYNERRIEGPLSINIPFFEMLEGGGKEDTNESVQEYIKSSLPKKLPKDKKVVVVCGKGNTSALVADLMLKEGYDAYSLAHGMAGWSDYYATRPIEESSKFSLFQIIRLSRGCLSYVILADKKAIIIDPLRDLTPYENLLKRHSSTISLILDTHAHADHISGGKALAEKYGVPYFLHPYDGIHPMDLLPATYSYEPSWDQKTYYLGNNELKTLHIPGHTLGNQAFLLNGKYLFSGDSIFIESIARPDLGGHAETWTALHYHSLRKLLELPDEVVVLPAHYGALTEQNEHHVFARTLGELKQKNEGLIMAKKSLEEFSKYILGHLPHFPKEYIEIKRVNIGLSKPNADEASELESGKNICALSQTKKGK